MGLNNKKIIVTSFLFLMLVGFVFSTTTTGIINFPVGGEDVGHTIPADFNFTDDQNVGYADKTVLITASIQDTNILTDFNTASGIADGRCVANDGTELDVNTGQVRCQLNISTALRNIVDGDATLTITTTGSDNAPDSNSSATFQIVKTYRIGDDADINSYTQSDLQDLTESGVGEGLRNIVLFIGLIIMVLVLVFVGQKAMALRKIK